MKAFVKCIIAGVVILFVGIAILIIALGVNGWSFKSPEFEMLSYTAENDNSAVELEIGAGRVKTQFYDGDKIQIEYPFYKLYTSEIHENNGVLSYKASVKKTLFWHRWNFPETIIKLPQATIFDLDFELDAGTVEIASGEYGKVEIDVNAGTLKINDAECSAFNCDVSAGTLRVEDLTCNTFDCEVSAGTLSVKSLECPEIKADISAGSLSLCVNGVKSEYTINASKSAGSCNITNQTGSTDKKLRVSVSAGSASVTFTG